MRASLYSINILSHEENETQNNTVTVFVTHNTYKIVNVKEKHTKHTKHTELFFGGINENVSASFIMLESNK